MLCQVKIIDIHGQPKGEKNRYIQSDLPPGMILHFYFPENEIPRLIRVTVGGKGQFCQTVAVSLRKFQCCKNNHIENMNDGIKLKVAILID